MNKFLIKQWPIVLGVLVLGYGVLLACFSREGFPTSMEYGEGMPYLSDRPVGEDAFYMLTAAWHLAEKGSIVYNFDKPITGIQPLATFIYAGVAKIVQLAAGDRWALVRSVLVLNVVLVGVFAVQIGGIARTLVARDREAGEADTELRQDLAYAVGVVTVLCSAWIFRAFTYGLEAGLYLVLLSLNVRHILAKDRIEHVRFGVLAGLTGLARIDFGVIFGLQLLWLLKERRLRLRDAVLTGAIAFAVTAPWFLWVYSKTGDPMPSSAGAEWAWMSAQDAAERLKWMRNALIWNASPWVSSWDYEINARWAIVTLLLFLALVAPTTYRSIRAHKPKIDTIVFRRLLGWGICIAAIVPIYVFGFWSWHFYGRYTLPLLVVTLPTIACLASIAATRLKLLIPSILLLSPACFAVVLYQQMHRGHMMLDLPINAGFVRNSVGDRTVVGAAQSGTVGYFNQNVLNLDGKADPEALRSIRQGNMRQYIDKQKVEVLIDWQSAYDVVIFKNGSSPDWRRCRRQPEGQSLCYVRKASLSTAADL